MSRRNLADDSSLEFSRVFDFSGSVVLVTGAANGIGKAIAELFSERGAELALIDKSPHIESVATGLGSGARSWEVDIIEEAEVARASAPVLRSRSVASRSPGKSPMRPCSWRATRRR